MFIQHLPFLLNPRTKNTARSAEVYQTHPARYPHQALRDHPKIVSVPDTLIANIEVRVEVVVAPCQGTIQYHTACPVLAQNGYSFPDIPGYVRRKNV